MLYIGQPEKVLERITQQYKITDIFWNKSNEPYQRETDHNIKKILKKLNIHYQVFNSNYLWKPTDILKNDGTYYKVFSAYKRKALQVAFSNMAHAPQQLTVINRQRNTFESVAHKLFIEKAWHQKITSYWQIGETHARTKLNFFIKKDINQYHEARNYPADDSTSKLSPHLHFGEISPLTIWVSIQNNPQHEDDQLGIQNFLNQLIWREFSSYLMYHFNTLHEKNFNPKFDFFPWSHNAYYLKKWQMGQTGYPFIDAGMRELWQTGFMHNRVRMVVASFLVKNLMIHWHEGRDWFSNCLIDADLENNSASWQWVAGSGADAAPYFRIFNPITQGKKFDPEGTYIRTYVPELTKLPNRYLFEPWHAPSDTLKQSNIILGETYPKPIIDLNLSRKKALAAYQTLPKRTKDESNQ